jgi:hypothetical protein
MSNKLNQKQVAHKLAEYCESLFYQNTVFRAVLIARDDITLVQSFSEIAIDPELKAEAHAVFAELYELIAASGGEIEGWELTSRLPSMPHLEL